MSGPVSPLRCSAWRSVWSLTEKSALVKRTYEAGMSVSLVARQEGVAASLLFQ